MSKELEPKETLTIGTASLGALQATQTTKKKTLQLPVWIEHVEKIQIATKSQGRCQRSVHLVLSASANISSQLRLVEGTLCVTVVMK